MPTREGVLFKYLGSINTDDVSEIGSAPQTCHSRNSFGVNLDTGTIC